MDILEKNNWQITLYGLLSAYVLFSYCYTFNYEMEIDEGCLLLTLAAAACLLISMAAIGRKNDRGFVGGPGCTFLLAICTLVIVTAQGNEHLLNLSSLVLLSSFLWSSERSIFEKAAWLLLLFFLVEVLIGMGQLLPQPAETRLLVKGTFGNTGVYAGYLVINLPFLKYIYEVAFARSAYRKWMMAAIVFLYGYSLMVICMVGARAALLAFSCMLIGTLVAEYRKKGIILILSLSLALAAVFAMSVWRSQIKVGSAYGRLLMLTVVEKHWSYRFWWGVGPGNFTWYYPQWQAAYFRDCPFQPPHFLVNAGESYLVFNEFIVLFKEVGVFGFLLFLFLLFRFYRMRSKAHPAYLKAAKCTVSGILILGLFSYPFHVAIMVLVFIFCVTSAFILEDRPSKRLFNSFRMSSYVALLNLILAASLIILAGRQAWAVWHWKSMRNDPYLSFQQKKQAFQRLLPALKYDGKFLVGYGEFLSQDSASLEESLAFLERSKRFLVTYRGYLSTATSYRYGGNYKKAIENYQFLSYYIPSRFLPKYEIMRAFLNQGDSINVERTARDILDMPIKIPSPEVERIREYADNYLINHGFRRKN